MKNRRVLGVLGLAGLLVSCASSPAATVEVMPAPNESVITVTRKSGVFLPGVPVDILIDGNIIAKLKAGGTRTFTIENGSHKIKAQMARSNIVPVESSFAASSTRITFSASVDSCRRGAYPSALRRNKGMRP